MDAHAALPPLIIGTDDYNELIFAATISRQHGNPHAEFLISELRRATICRPDDLPASVVSTNSRVTFRLDGRCSSVTRVLVRPADLMWPNAELSAMTPLGTALLGLRVGDRMPFRTEDGQQSQILVQEVGRQSLADGARCERVWLPSPRT